MDISCSKNEDQLRITIDKIQKFDENYAPSLNAEYEGPASERFSQRPQKNLSQKVLISVDNLEKLKTVRELVSNFRKNGNHIIELKLDNKQIALQGTYSLSTYDILDIRNAVGLENVKIN